MDFSIRIAQPPGDQSWRCFYEVARGIAYSLQQLGHDCVLDLERKLDINSRRLILFNAHTLAESVSIPYDAIIFNAEQVQLEGPIAEAWKSSPYVKHLRKHIVFDYSQENISRLAKLGVNRAVHCSIGYWSGLSDLPEVTEDNDVLFVGSLNDRRNQVIKKIASRGVKVHVLSGIYGDERNAWMARSKVILNTHFYPNPIWEIVRASHPLANKKCVVTEDGGVDNNLEWLAKEACACVPYDKLDEICAERVKGNWKEVGQHGFDVFSKCDQVEYVREALKFI